MYRIVLKIGERHCMVECYCRLTPEQYQLLWENSEPAKMKKESYPMKEMVMAIAVVSTAPSRVDGVYIIPQLRSLRNQSK